MQFLKETNLYPTRLFIFQDVLAANLSLQCLSLGNSSDVSDFAAQVAPIEGAVERHRFTRCCGRSLWVSQIGSQVSQRTHFLSVIHVFFHSAHCPRGLLVSRSETIALKRCNKNSVTYETPLAQRGTNQTPSHPPQEKIAFTHTRCPTR